MTLVYAIGWAVVAAALAAVGMGVRAYLQTRRDRKILRTYKERIARADRLRHYEDALSAEPIALPPLRERGEP